MAISSGEVAQSMIWREQRSPVSTLSERSSSRRATYLLCGPGPVLVHSDRGQVGRDPLQHHQPDVRAAVLVQLLDDRVADVCGKERTDKSTTRLFIQKEDKRLTVARELDAVVHQLHRNLVIVARLADTHVEPLLSVAQSADVVSSRLGGAVRHRRDGRVVGRRRSKVCAERGKAGRSVLEAHRSG